MGVHHCNSNLWNVHIIQIKCINPPTHQPVNQAAGCAQMHRISLTVAYVFFMTAETLGAKPRHDQLAPVCQNPCQPKHDQLAPVCQNPCQPKHDQLTPVCQTPARRCQASSEPKMTWLPGAPQLGRNSMCGLWGLGFWQGFLFSGKPRPIGRPHLTWMDTAMHDMGSLGRTLQIDLPRDWANLALHRDVWRGVVSRC